MKILKFYLCLISVIFSVFFVASVLSYVAYSAGLGSGSQIFVFLLSFGVGITSSIDIFSFFDKKIEGKQQ